MTSTMTIESPHPTLLAQPAVSRAEWLEARRELLAEERKLTRALDALNEKRRALPWVLVEKPYVFQGPDGPRTLGELFEGRSQLLVHHLMFAPGDAGPCVGCAFQADQVEGSLVHLEFAGVKYVAISRAPWEDLAPFKKRMGWAFDWYSAAETSFNYDFGVSFTPEQVATGSVGYNYDTSPYAFEDLPGMSVFVRDQEGNVYHTYSTYARGLDMLIATHHFLDLTPGGRNEPEEAGPGWLRFHDLYGAEYLNRPVEDEE